MQSKEWPPAAAQDLILGVGVQVTGKVRGLAGVQIFGVLEGELEAGHVLVGESGRVTGSLTADEADVHGEISQDVHIRGHLILRSTSRFTGRLRYRSISIESGARLNGSLSVLQPGSATEPRSNPPEQTSPTSSAAAPVMLRLCRDAGRKER